MNLGFFCPKMAVSWLKTVLQKMGCWNPYFYSVFWVRVFWPSCQKREILDTHQKKKRKKWLITEKLFFWYFCVFLVFFVFLFVFFFFCFFSFLFLLFFCFLFFVFLGGFKGQVRWPEGPPHLALNPPYLLFVLFFCFCFVFCFGGFKGQVRWPKGPPHLALNPPYLFFFVFFGLSLFLSFLCFVLQKNLVFPLEKGIFGLFLSVSLCSSLGFFGLPLFQFFFLCLSLLLLLFSFLPVFLFCFLLLPCFCLFLSFSFFSAFVSWKETTSERLMYKVFLHQFFLFFGFLSSFLFEIPFSSLCFLLI